MTSVSPLVIRPARSDDDAEVARLYEICLRTGAAGSDATAQYTDPKLLGHVYVGPYLAYRSKLAFVLADAADVPQGYVLGVADTYEFEQQLAEQWWPALRSWYPRDSYPAGTADGGVVGLIHGWKPTPEVVLADYSAHLHIDLLPAAQGGGNGRRLLEHLLDELRARGVGGVHLGVDAENERAIGFYRHLGFTPLDVSGASGLMGLRLA